MAADLRAALPIGGLMSRASLRQPIIYVTLTAIPASYVLMMFLVSGRTLGRTAILGSVVAAGTNAGIISLPQVLLGYRTRRLQDMYTASPVTPHAYLLGAALSRLVYVAPVIVVSLGAFIVVSGFQPTVLAGLVVLVATSWITGSVLGFLVTARLPDPASVAAASNMLGVLLVLVPPIYYPVDLLGPRVAYAALLVPTADVAVIARALTGLAPEHSPYLVPALAMLTAWVVLGGTYGWRHLRWQA
jgi:ABC-2 type transport system permease protein